MEPDNHKLRHATIALLCFLSIGFGFYAGQLTMVLSGAAGIVYVGAAAASASLDKSPLIGTARIRVGFRSAPNCGKARSET